MKNPKPLTKNQRRKLAEWVGWIGEETTEPFEPDINPEHAYDVTCKLDETGSADVAMMKAICIVALQILKEKENA